MCMPYYVTEADPSKSSGYNFYEPLRSVINMYAQVFHADTRTERTKVVLMSEDINKRQYTLLDLSSIGYPCSFTTPTLHKVGITMLDSACWTAIATNMHSPMVRRGPPNFRKHSRSGKHKLPS